MNSSLTPFSEFFKLAEDSVSDDPASYRGLDIRALCTDPDDLVAIFNETFISGSWIDLGSGFGHTVIAYSQTFPDRKALGIEREFSRVEVSRKIAREMNLNTQFIHGDLLTTELPDGDNYFLYFPQGHVFDRILFELSKKMKFTLVAIESHGDFFSRLEKEKWLTLVKEIPLKSQRLNPFARVYQPNDLSRTLSGLHQFSFTENFFLISDGKENWWGDSFGLYASGDDYLLCHPPRTVKEKEVVKTLTKNELPDVLSFLIQLRRLPDLEVTTGGKNYAGPIRKILGSETFSVEFPGGEKLQWKDIDRIKQGSQLCYDSSSQFFFLPPAH